MTNTAMQKKIEKFVQLGNALDAEAKRRFGVQGFLFHEADGGVYIMSGDDNGSASTRQKFIQFSAKGCSARWGAGAW